MVHGESVVCCTWRLYFPLEEVMQLIGDNIVSTFIVIQSDLYYVRIHKVCVSISITKHTVFKQ